MTQNLFQTGMDVASGLEGLRRNQQSQNIMANQEMRVQDETAYQTGQREASAQAGQALSALKQQYADSGDPAIMRQIIMADPEFASGIQKQFGVIDDNTRDQALNAAASLKQMIETNPQEAMNFWQNNLAQNEAFAGLADNFEAGDIEGAMNEIGWGITALGGQEAYDSVYGTGTDKDSPMSVREWEYYQKLPDDQKQQYINMKRANQLYKQGDVTMQVDPVGGGGAVVTEQGTDPATQPEAQEVLTEQQTVKSASVKAAEQAIKLSGEAFGKLSTVRAAIPNLDEAMALVDQGANTGPIISKLPSVQQASLELDNLQGRLGLDVIGNTTFGALSESELKFALNTALPRGLKGPALKEWLQRKKDSQIKLSDYLEDAAIFLGTPGNTIADFLAEKKAEAPALSELSDDDLMNF